MNTSIIEACNKLISQQRWAALATVRNGAPYSSMVAYAADITSPRLLLHLSTLAPHTQHILKEPRVSMVISELDNQAGDPQQLARVTLSGVMQAIRRDDKNYPEDKQRYLSRLPDAQMLFDFSDFSLYEMKIEKVRYIGGFAQAHSIDPDKLVAP